MSGWVAGAIVVGAVVGAGASYMASENTSEAIKESSKDTKKTTADTNAMLQGQYEQNREDLEPWRTTGSQALEAIKNTPDFEFTPESFEALKDPSYEFRKQEGINALDRSAASRGRVLSGGQDRAITRYGSDLASQEYGNAFNRAKTTYDTNLNTQKSLAGVGQSATNQLVSSGNNLTNNIANNSMQGTQAQNALAMQGAKSTSDMYGNVAQGVNQGIGNYLLYQNTKAINGKG